MRRQQWRPPPESRDLKVVGCPMRTKISEPSTKQFWERVQARCALSCIGRTSIHSARARGAPPARTLDETHRFLASIDMWRLHARSHREFSTLLDVLTAELVKAMPKGRGGYPAWGLARKGLNLFLRDAVGDRRLSARYGIERIIPWLELPLDSHTMNSLRGYDPTLPPTPAIKRLTPDTSAAYQASASRLATASGLDARVDLDVLLWNNARVCALVRKVVATQRADSRLARVRSRRGRST